MSSESALRGLVAQVGRDGKAIPSAGTAKSGQRPGLGMAAVPTNKPFLGPQTARDKDKKTLVLDLDETLVHSSFKEVPNASFIIPVEIEGQKHDIFVCKRPGVDEFLRHVAQFFEVVIFTASLSTYANPLMDLLDPHRVCAARLFREHCTFYRGSYVKDLSRLGRPLEHIIIIDNSPVAYSLQPDNAIPIRSWFDDPSDRELYDLMPILQALCVVDDLPEVLRATLRDYDDEEYEDDHAQQQQQQAQQKQLQQQQQAAQAQQKQQQDQYYQYYLQQQQQQQQQAAAAASAQQPSSSHRYSPPPSPSRQIPPHRGDVYGSASTQRPSHFQQLPPAQSSSPSSPQGTTRTSPPAARTTSPGYGFASGTPYVPR